VLRLFGGKELPERGFIGLPRFGGSRRVLAEFLDGNHMLVALRLHP